MARPLGRLIRLLLVGAVLLCTRVASSTCHTEPPSVAAAGAPCWLRVGVAPAAIPYRTPFDPHAPAADVPLSYGVYDGDGLPLRAPVVGVAATLRWEGGVHAVTVDAVLRSGPAAAPTIVFPALPPVAATDVIGGETSHAALVVTATITYTTNAVTDAQGRTVPPLGSAAATTVLTTTLPVPLLSPTEHVVLLAPSLPSAPWAPAQRSAQEPLVVWAAVADAAGFLAAHGGADAVFVVMTACGGTTTSAVAATVPLDPNGFAQAVLPPLSAKRDGACLPVRTLVAVVGGVNASLVLPTARNVPTNVAGALADDHATALFRGLPLCGVTALCRAASGARVLPLPWNVSDGACAVRCEAFDGAAAVVLPDGTDHEVRAAADPEVRLTLPHLPGLSLSQASGTAAVVPFNATLSDVASSACPLGNRVTVTAAMTLPLGAVSPAPPLPQGEDAADLCVSWTALGSADLTGPALEVALSAAGEPRLVRCLSLAVVASAIDATVAEEGTATLTIAATCVGPVTDEFYANGVRQRSAQVAARWGADVDGAAPWTAPRITSVAFPAGGPCRPAPALGGADPDTAACTTEGPIPALTIMGSHFGRRGVVVTVGGTPCGEVSFLALAEDTVTLTARQCPFPNGSSTAAHRELRVGVRAPGSAATAASALRLITAPPVLITAVVGCGGDDAPSAGLCSSTAPTRVTLLGHGFAPPPWPPSVMQPPGAPAALAVSLLEESLGASVTCADPIVVELPVAKVPAGVSAAGLQAVACTAPAARGNFRPTVQSPSGQVSAPTRAVVSYAVSAVVACPVDVDRVMCSGRGECDFSTAACLCTGNWSDAACDECLPGRYGPQCSGVCPVCDRGTCDEGVAGRGTCTCEYGYGGPLCDTLCPVAELVVNGVTTAAVCGGHGVCDPHTALCQCNASIATGFWGGAVCLVCDAAYRGDECRVGCPVGAGGLVCSGGDRGTCNPEAVCVCKAQFCDTACDKTGAVCGGCPYGYWGPGCTEECIGGAATPCSGHGRCADGPLGNGLCECSGGYTGRGCTGTCPPSPANPCSGNGVCDANLARCACTVGWGGAGCDRRCPGPSDAPCNGHGACANDDAACECTFGYTGAACDEACPGGLQQPCSLHGRCLPNATCDCFDSDATAATEGMWQDPVCTECAPEWWGPRCNAQCPFANASDGTPQQCAGHGACTHSLQCQCFASGIIGHWAGERCTECAPGYWGPLCREECTGSACNACSLHGTCDDGRGGDGSCECHQGAATGFWAGAACDQCRPAYYGRDCATACPGLAVSTGAVCNAHGTCGDGVFGTGVCACTGTYGGHDCGACRAGYFGAACEQQCRGGAVLPCSGHGQCNATFTSDGSCRCDPGFVGSACERACGGTDAGPCNNLGQCVLRSSGEAECTNCAQGPITGHWAGVVCADCAPGYFSQGCTLACPGGAGNPCNGHGTCSDGRGGSGQCSCVLGYAGAACDAVCPGGAQLPCGGHGECRGLAAVCACHSDAVQGWWAGTACGECRSNVTGATCTVACPVAVAGGPPCSGRGVCFEGVCAGCTGSSCGAACEITEAAVCAAHPAPCLPSRFGADCAPCPGGTASPCSAHGRCSDGRQGSGRCFCDAGYGGPLCSQRCPEVGGVACNGRGQCSISTGVVCACDEGYAGPSCALLCGGFDAVPGSSACSGHGRCDPITGSCSCDPTFGGPGCGVQCSHNATGALCGGHGICDQGTGACVCEASEEGGHWGGAACDRCAPRYAGLGRCTTLCVFGASDQSYTGCVCDSGFYGPACALACPRTAAGGVCDGHGVCLDGAAGSGVCRCQAEYYGPACAVHCTAAQCDLLLTNGMCHTGTGGCVCLATAAGGHWAADDTTRAADAALAPDTDPATVPRGHHCTRCQREYFGAFCQSQCSCSGHGLCDRRSGSCACDASDGAGHWAGTRCAQCAEGYAGAVCNVPNVRVSRLGVLAAAAPTSRGENFTTAAAALCLVGADPAARATVVAGAEGAVLAPNGTVICRRPLGAYHAVACTNTERDGEVLMLLRAPAGFVAALFSADTCALSVDSAGRPFAAAASALSAAQHLMTAPPAATEVQLGTGPALVALLSAPAPLLSVFAATAPSPVVHDAGSVFAAVTAVGPGAASFAAVGGVGLSGNLLVGLLDAATGAAANVTEVTPAVGVSPSITGVVAVGPALVAVLSSAAGSYIACHDPSRSPPWLTQQAGLGAVNVTAVAADRVAGQAFLALEGAEADGTSVVLRVVADRCAIAGQASFSVVAATTERAVRLQLDPATRALHAAVPVPTLQRVVLLAAFAVTAVAPSAADTAGGTPVTVTGEGFPTSAVPGIGPRCVFVAGGDTAVPASVLSATTAVCPAPPGTAAACGGALVEFGVAVTSVSVVRRTANAALLRRLATPTVTAAWSGPDSARLGFVPLTGGAVSLAGAFSDCPGCADTMYRCALAVPGPAGTVELQVTAVAQRVSARLMTCTLPPLPRPPRPSYLEASIDGYVFSRSAVPMAYFGPAVGLAARQQSAPSRDAAGFTAGDALDDTAVVTVPAAAEVPLPWVAAAIVDSAGHALRAAASGLSGVVDAALGAGPAAVLAGVVRVRLQDGVANFSALLLRRPAVGEHRLVLSLPAANWTTTAVVTVTEGVPFALQLLTPPSNTTDNTAPVLAQQPVLGIVDGAGNRVTDSAVLRQWDVRATWAGHNLADQLAPSSLAITAAPGATVYVSEGLAVTGLRGHTYRITFTGVRFSDKATLQGGAAVSAPIHVLPCPTAAEYATEGSARCTLCPSAAICDGGFYVAAAPNYWRGSNRSLAFYSCAPPYSADSCRDDARCDAGFEGPRCSVCSVGYGALGLQCVKCSGKAVNAALVGVLVAAVLLVFVALVCSVTVGSTSNLVAVTFRNLVTHTQLLAKLAAVDIPWPSVLRGMWDLFAWTQLEPLGIAPIDCVGEGAVSYLDKYVALMVAPFLLVAVTVPIAWAALQALSRAVDDGLGELVARTAQVCGGDGGREATATADLNVVLAAQRSKGGSSSGASGSSDTSLSRSTNPLALSALSDTPLGESGSRRRKRKGAKAARPADIGARSTFLQAVLRHREARFTWASAVAVTAMVVFTLLYPTLVESSGRLLRCEDIDFGPAPPTANATASVASLSASNDLSGSTSDDGDVAGDTAPEERRWGVAPVFMYSRLIFCDTAVYGRYRAGGTAVLLLYGVLVPAAIVAAALAIRRWGAPPGTGPAAPQGGVPGGSGAGGTGLFQRPSRSAGPEKPSASQRRRTSAPMERDAAWEHSALSASAGEVRMRTLLAFFVGGFRPSMWFWETTNMLRKFLAVCVIVFVTDSQLQVMCLLWLAIAALVAHMALHPYLDRSLHLVEAVAQSTAVVTINVVLLFFLLDGTASSGRGVATSAAASEARPSVGTSWQWAVLIVAIMAANAVALIAYALLLAYHIGTAWRLMWQRWRRRLAGEGKLHRQQEGLEEALEELDEQRGANAALVAEAERLAAEEHDDHGICAEPIDRLAAATPRPVGTPLLDPGLRSPAMDEFVAFKDAPGLQAVGSGDLLPPVITVGAAEDAPSPAAVAEPAPPRAPANVGRWKVRAVAPRPPPMVRGDPTEGIVVREGGEEGEEGQDPTPDTAPSLAPAELPPPGPWSLLDAMDRPRPAVAAQEGTDGGEGSVRSDEAPPEDTPAAALALPSLTAQNSLTDLDTPSLLGSSAGASGPSTAASSAMRPRPSLVRFSPPRGRSASQPVMSSTTPPRSIIRAASRPTPEHADPTAAPQAPTTVPRGAAPSVNPRTPQRHSFGPRSPLPWLHDTAPRPRNPLRPPSPRAGSPEKP